MVEVIIVLLSGVRSAYEQRSSTKVKGVHKLSIPQFQCNVVNICTALCVEQDGG